MSETATTLWLRAISNPTTHDAEHIDAATIIIPEEATPCAKRS